MGEKKPVNFCLAEAGKLAEGGHHSAALIYLVQAAELISKGFLASKKGVKPPYFAACIPYLKEASVITDDEEMKLRRINTMRNLAIHTGLLISREEYSDARKYILRLIKKLK